MKSFPGVRALDKVSLSVRAGEVHALVGQNGAGKSTLVKCVTGVLHPDGGSITFDGEPINTYSPRYAYDLGIAVVHQRTQLLKELSVTENLQLGQLPTRSGGSIINWAEAHRRSHELLNRFKLELDPRVPVAQLSVYERQEVAIARALSNSAKLLVLDEPTAALDAAQSERLFGIVESLKAQGIAILYISHYLEEIFRLADTITVLRDGEIVASEPPAALSQTEVVTLMAGERPENSDTPNPIQTVGTAGAKGGLSFLQVTSDTLHGVSFEVRKGEVVGLTGVLGAGGHEIAQVLFGLTRLRSGQVLVDGEPYNPRSPHAAIARGLFLVPEDTSGEGLVSMLPITQNLTLGNLNAITAYGGFLQLRQERQVTRGYVARLRIATASINTTVRNLSGGNQQKVLIGKALMTESTTLVLEEPTQGVDINATAEVHHIIRDAAASGNAILVISTDVSDLLDFTDRIVALRRGSVVRDVRTSETSYAELLDATIGSVGA